MARGRQACEKVLALSVLVNNVIPCRYAGQEGEAEGSRVSLQLGGNQPPRPGVCQ